MNAKDTQIVCRQFPGKDVFVFSDHSVALKAWAKVRVSQGIRPLLFTLDHHTDTREAFLSYGCGRAGNRDNWQDYAEEALARINISDVRTLDEALLNLRHDEHIRAAIRLGIIDTAFVLTDASPPEGGTRSNEEEAYHKAKYGNIVDMLFGPEPPPVPPRPHTYALPASRIFYFPNLCFVGCTAMPHTDDCLRPHADQAIEAILLNDKLAHCSEMLPSLGRQSLWDEPFILDIDLDYFITEKSLAPDDASTFCQMIKKALAITIALEPQHVDWAKMDDAMTANSSLAAILAHVENAVGKEKSRFTF